MKKKEKTNEYFLYQGKILNLALQIESKLDNFISIYFVSPKSSKTHFFQDLVISKTKLSFEQKRTIFKAICEKEGLGQNFSDISPSINSIQKTRNNIAHWILERTYDNDLQFKNHGSIYSLDEEVYKRLKQSFVKVWRGIRKIQEKIQTDGSFETQSLEKHKFGWQEKFNLVKKFIEENSKYPSSSSNDKIEYQLAVWVYQQRSFRKNLRKNHNEQEIESLQSLPDWYWDNEGLWELNYNKLKKFLKENNNVYPTRRNIINPEIIISKEEEQLNKWVKSQREDYHGGRDYPKLNLNKIEKLKKLPGWFWKKNKSRKK